MGGSTPQTQQTQQTQNTTSVSEPSPFIQPWLKNIGEKLGGYLNQHASAPALYGDSFTAPMSDATKSGIAALTNLGNSGSSPLNQANNTLATDTMNGKFLDPGNNPYLQKYLKAGFDQQNDSYMNTVLPGLRSQFAGTGRTGSGADFNVAMRGVSDLQRGQALAASGAESGAYSDERGRQLQTQGMMPNFLGMDLTRAGALGQAGDKWDAYNQKLRDEAVYRDAYAKTGDLDYWSNMASRLLGAVPGGITTGSGTSSGYSTLTPSSNPTSSILGGALGAAGLGLQLAKFLPFSDRRLKEDIKPVGKLHDGQTIYSYKFRGSPRTEIGLLAQEVERVHPEAVHVDPATGFKKVHYGLATAPAGGLL